MRLEALCHRRQITAPKHVPLGMTEPYHQPICAFPRNAQTELGQLPEVEYLLHPAAKIQLLPDRRIRHCPSPAISTLSGATDATVASQLGIQSDISRDANHKIVRCVCHFLNISNPSADESFFLLCVRDFGFKQATFLAAISQLQFQRPSRGSRARTNAPARNYSVRSAKRKPPSGSQVSSRKRSSSA